MKTHCNIQLKILRRSSALLIKVILIALLPLASNVSADSYMSLEEIKLLVHDFTQNHYQQRFPDYKVDINVVRLDSRTKLKSCEESLTLTAPKVLNRSGNSLIAVRCAAPVPWKIFVPTQISVEREVLVATGPIARNSPIGASNTRTKKINLNGFRDEYISKLDNIKGMIAKRSFRDGQPIITSQLTTPMLVNRGDAVVISAKTGATQVKINGIAQAAGKKGDQILVKNSHSNRTIKAMVIGRKRVAVVL